MKYKSRGFLLRAITTIISGTACGVLLCQTEYDGIFCINTLLLFGLLCVLTLRLRFGEYLFRPAKPILWIVSAVLSVSMAYHAKSTFFSSCAGRIWSVIGLLGLPHGDLIAKLVPWAAALLALPAMLLYMKLLLGFLAELFRSIFRGKTWRELLLPGLALVVFSVLIILVYGKTQAFYGAHLDGKWYNFDLVYSSDSGYLAVTDVFRNIGADQNDLRQPLFGLFSLPFAETAGLISRLLPFWDQAYLGISQILQLAAYLTTLVMLAELLELRPADRVLFQLLMLVSWPMLVYVLSVEQYLLAVFYLVALIYFHDREREGSVLYIAATGSLLTSGLLFPLVTWRRDFRAFVKNTLKLCGEFFAVVILSGNFTAFLEIPKYIGEYAYYDGSDVTLLSKLLQYVNFLGSLVLSPVSGVDTTTYSHPSWQMQPVVSWSVTGFIVLGLAVLGVILTRKQKFSRLCGVWMAYSLLMLGIVGWGTVDNGLMLYTLYFAWAFLAMAFAAVRAVTGRLSAVRYLLVGAVIVGAGVYNCAAFREMLSFCTTYFPVKG